MESMGNMIVSGSAVYKAGASISPAIPEEAWTEWVSGAESYINVATGKNWSDAYSSINDDLKHILTDTASNIVATHAIAYDMSGANRVELEDRINLLWARANQNIAVLKEIGTEGFMT